MENKSSKQLLMEKLDNLDKLVSNAEKSLSIYEASLEVSTSELRNEVSKMSNSLGILKEAASMEDNPFNEKFLELHESIVQDSANRVIKVTSELLNKQAEFYKSE